MSTSRVRRVARFAAALVLAASSARADHDLPCRALPTSAQRPVQVSCNPRQKCLDAISISGPARSAAEQGCRALPTGGTCPGTETFNPQDECIRKLPKPPDVRIDSVAGSAFADGDSVKNIRPDQYLVVRGKNVGMVGNHLKGDQSDFTISRRSAALAGCDAPGCVVLDVKGTARWADICEESRRRRTFTITEAWNHNSARGSFAIAGNDITPRPPQLPGPQPSATVPYVQIGTWKRGTFGNIVADGFERNAITVKKPMSGQTKITLRTSHDLVRADFHYATLDASGNVVISAPQGQRYENVTRGSDVHTFFFNMWVQSPQHPCDPQPEGTLQLVIETENGLSRDKAMGTYWIPPRG